MIKFGSTIPCLELGNPAFIEGLCDSGLLILKLVESFMKCHKALIDGPVVFDGIFANSTYLAFELGAARLPLTFVSVLPSSQFQATHLLRLEDSSLPTEVRMMSSFLLDLSLTQLDRVHTGIVLDHIYAYLIGWLSSERQVYSNSYLGYKIDDLGSIERFKHWTEADDQLINHYSESILVNYTKARDVHPTLPAIIWRDYGFSFARFRLKPYCSDRTTAFMHAINYWGGSNIPVKAAMPPPVCSSSSEDASRARIVRMASVASTRSADE
jgi:hypothetical protein